jgi:hypothetical protein
MGHSRTQRLHQRHSEIWLTPWSGLEDIFALIEQRQRELRCQPKRRRCAELKALESLTEAFHIPGHLTGGLTPDDERD